MNLLHKKALIWLKRCRYNLRFWSLAGGLLAAANFMVIPLQAQSIDPALLERFKRLPPQQQQQLAQQYGIDLNTLDILSNNNRDFKLGDIPNEMRVNQKSLFSDHDALNLTDFLDEQEYNGKMMAEEELPLFGSNIFDQAVSTFSTTDNLKVPDDYRLGIGDELFVQFYGQENQQVTLQVQRDGNITFPKLGPISVSGLSYADAIELIKSKVSEQLIGVNVAISMARLRAINVFMAGELETPGSYVVSSMTTLSQALYQAGGLSPIGSMRNIQVKRAGEVVSTFDVYQLLLSGDTSGDIRLRSGDVIFVPPYEGIVTVEGEVKRPGRYEVRDNETLRDVINMAAGVTAKAFDRGAILTSFDEQLGLRKTITLDLRNESVFDMPMLDGFNLMVRKQGDALANTITFDGALARPGSYGFFSGIRVSDIVSDLRRDTLPTTDLNYALIVRQVNENLDIEVTQFSPSDAVLKQGTEFDPRLQEKDRVVFFKLPSLTDLDVELEDEYEEPRAEQQLDPFNTLNLGGLSYAGGLSSEVDDQGGANTANTRTQLSAADRALQSRQFARQFEQDEARRQARSLEFQDLDEAKKLENSRKELLAPIIEKLASQATPEQPVAVARITGSVRAPGKYPINDAYSIAELINAAGGLKDSAFVQSGELRRLISTSDGALEATYIQVDLTDQEALSTTYLQSRDQLNIRQVADWDPDYAVTLRGEVVFPGKYFIQRGETLASVIKRAGGLTQDAFASGAIFTRKAVAELETERAKEFAEQVRRSYAASLLTKETASTTIQEIEVVASRLEQFEGKGRLLIDLVEALSGNQANDIELVDGDKLVIPRKVNTVTVVGEVRRQGTHTFQRGLDIDDYINLSAGFSARSDEDAIYIVKANGSVVIPKNDDWSSFSPSFTLLEPGDSIVVPVDSDYQENIAFWRDITQIIYQGTVTIAALSRL